MSYSREYRKRIKALQKEIAAHEEARKALDFQLDDKGFRLFGDAFNTARDEIYSAMTQAQSTLEKIEKEAEDELKMRKTAKYARENPDSHEATVFSDTYHRDPARVESPEDDSCVVM